MGAGGGEQAEELHLLAGGSPGPPWMLNFSEATVATEELDLHRDSVFTQGVQSHAAQAGTPLVVQLRRLCAQGWGLPPGVLWLQPCPEQPPRGGCARHRLLELGSV